MNSFLRPKRSVSCPNTSAPTQAPATYSEPAKPETFAAEIPTPAPFSPIRPEMLPTIVTSSPSRIHTVPSPMITRQ